MSRFICAAVVILGLAVYAPAGTVLLNTSDSPFDAGVDNQGWWSGTFGNADTNDAYITGKLLLGAGVRSFLTFDLRTLEGTVNSATLELARYTYDSPDNTETVGAYAVSTDATTLNNNNSANATIYNDLGSGTSYGSFVVARYTASSTETLSFVLNANAVADIQAASGGFFSIGLALTSINTASTEAIFSASDGPGIQRLVLDVQPAIPLPAALWSGLALLGMMGVRHLRLANAKGLCR